VFPCDLGLASSAFKTLFSDTIPEAVVVSAAAAPCVEHATVGCGAATSSESTILNKVAKTKEVERPEGPVGALIVSPKGLWNIVPTSLLTITTAAGNTPSYSNLLIIEDQAPILLTSCQLMGSKIVAHVLPLAAAIWLRVALM